LQIKLTAPDGTVWVGTTAERGGLQVRQPCWCMDL
jgi:hypothetical protein